MRKWNERAREVAYLYNPAFCGRILYATIKTYNDKTLKPMPFPLAYIILPLIMHKPTRNKITSRTKFSVWIQRNPELLIDFAARANGLIEITNEAIEFLLSCRLIEICPDGGIQVVKTKRSLSKTKFVDDEIKECILKGENVARWFASAGTVETIYISLGVRP